jgi:hypothetical protein
MRGEHWFKRQWLLLEVAAGRLRRGCFDDCGGAAALRPEDMNNVPHSSDYWYGVRILELLAARLWVVVRDRGATRRGGSMILTVFAGIAEFEAVPHPSADAKPPS